MAAITRAAVEKGICDPALLPQVLDILEAIRLPTEVPIRWQTFRKPPKPTKSAAACVTNS